MNRRRATPWRRPIAARAYDALTGPFEAGMMARWRRRQWAELPATGTGLEIGIGTGANAPHHPPGAHIIGLDYSPAMLRRLRERPEAAALPILAGDVMRLPFATASLDWAAATLVFCEVPDAVRGLREVRRVLRPGGRFVLVEHVRPSGLLGHAARAATALTAPLIGEHFDRDTAAAVRDAGFELHTEERLWRDIVLLLVARAPA
jgi:ubiquinone/menaquinone biosynthesis C-methylase UbiE